MAETNGGKIQCFDPDPDWIRSVDPYPDQESGSASRGAKITYKNLKIKKFHVFKCWMFSFEG
jgi:hypothetical protein